MLKVSIGGKEPVPASSVVIFDDDIPAAVAMDVEGTVVFADSARDDDFLSILQQVGIPTNKMHKYRGLIQGRMPGRMM